MARTVIVDTGPLVALLNAREYHHDWVTTQLSTIPAPLLTCEPVLSETDHLLRRGGVETGLAVKLMQRGVVRIGLSLSEQSDAIAKLQFKYRDIPASLADASLVRMSELHENCVVMTFDTDFHVYRRHGRRIIPMLSPD